MRPAAAVVGAWVLAWIVPAIVLSGPLLPASRAQESSPDGWRAFQGSWSAVGQRHTLPTGGSRAATVVQLSGAVVLTDPAGGFQGEVIAFDDGGSLSAGRAAWTDAKGDQVFSALRGESLQTGRRIVGTITGGTGQYAGVTGEYTLTWQYVVAGDGDVVQGRTADLRGRFHHDGSRR